MQSDNKNIDIDIDELNYLEYHEFLYEERISSKYKLSEDIDRDLNQAFDYHCDEIMKMSDDEFDTYIQKLYEKTHK